MGREGTGRVEVDGGVVDVRLHLDAAELCLRGGIRRRIPRGDIVDATADDGAVVVQLGAERLRIEVGEQANRWARALTTAPPTLAERLGITAGTLVHVRGEPPESVVAVLQHARVGTPADAAVVLVVLADGEQLEQLPGWLRGRAPGTPVWVVHGKGRARTPGGDQVRAVMRAAGFRDTKVSGISEDWSATRYS